VPLVVLPLDDDRLKMISFLSSPISWLVGWLVEMNRLFPLFLGYSMSFAELIIAARSPNRKRTASQPLLRARQETANNTIDDQDVLERHRKRDV
jgi:hypothetical protein